MSKTRNETIVEAIMEPCEGCGSLMLSKPIIIDGKIDGLDRCCEECGLEQTVVFPDEVVEEPVEEPEAVEEPVEPEPVRPSTVLSFLSFDGPEMMPWSEPRAEGC
jgi:hypothetical protein